MFTFKQLYPTHPHHLARPLARSTVKQPDKIVPSPCPGKYRKNTQGWSLVELLSVLAIMMTLTGLGVPNFNLWLQQKTEASVLKTLYHLCNLARTRAVKDNSYLTLCASEDLQHCNGRWNKTVIVFSDMNKNETVDKGETLYKAITFPKTTPCLEWKAGAHRQYLQYKPTGASNGTAGQFKFCDSVSNTIKKAVVVSFNGRTSLKNL